MEYTDNRPIVRNTELPYSVTVSAGIANNGKYSVLQNTGQGRNFKSWYFMTAENPPGKPCDLICVGHVQKY